MIPWLPLGAGPGHHPLVLLPYPGPVGKTVAGGAFSSRGILILAFPEGAAVLLPLPDTSQTSQLRRGEQDKKPQNWSKVASAFSRAAKFCGSGTMHVYIRGI